MRVTQAKHAAISGYFPHKSVLTTQEATTFHLLSKYVLITGGVNTLRPCVLSTFKVHGEYYYRTCEVCHTQTMHVTSTIKVYKKYAHNVGKLMNLHKKSAGINKSIVSVKKPFKSDNL